jgi:uncharacterized protein RhaS with RHS repeats
MRCCTCFVGALLLSASCGGQLATSTTTSTTATPDQSFQCVQQQMDALGYRRSSYDADERRVTGTKIDMKSRRADTQFRRMLDRLQAEVKPQSDGKTSIQVVAHTFAEYTTQRGPTEVEEKASSEVRSAAQELLERCRS